MYALCSFCFVYKPLGPTGLQISWGDSFDVLNSTKSRNHKILFTATISGILTQHSQNDSQQKRLQNKRKILTPSVLWLDCCCCIIKVNKSFGGVAEQSQAKNYDQNPLISHTKEKSIKKIASLKFEQKRLNFSKIFLVRSFKSKIADK